MAWRYYIGLGHALCVVKRLKEEEAVPETEALKYSGTKWALSHTPVEPSPPQAKQHHEYQVIYLRRFGQMPYTKVIEHVKEVLRSEVFIPDEHVEGAEIAVPLRKQSMIVVGGVETPGLYYELLTKRNCAVGQVILAKKKKPSHWPKIEIDRPTVISVFQLLMEQQQIHFAGDLEEGKSLLQQIQTVTLEESEQPDDLVLALALAVWYAERQGGGPAIRRL